MRTISLATAALQQNGALSDVALADCGFYNLLEVAAFAVDGNPTVRLATFLID